MAGVKDNNVSGFDLAVFAFVLVDVLFADGRTLSRRGSTHQPGYVNHVSGADLIAQGHFLGRHFARTNAAILIFKLMQKLPCGIIVVVPVKAVTRYGISGRHKVRSRMDVEHVLTYQSRATRLVPSVQRPAQVGCSAIGNTSTGPPYRQIFTEKHRQVRYSLQSSRVDQALGSLWLFYCNHPRLPSRRSGVFGPKHSGEGAGFGKVFKVSKVFHDQHSVAQSVDMRCDRVGAHRPDVGTIYPYKRDVLSRHIKHAGGIDSWISRGLTADGVGHVTAPAGQSLIKLVRIPGV